MHKKILDRPEAFGEFDTIEPDADRAFLLDQYQKSQSRFFPRSKHQKKTLILVGTGLIILALFFTFINIIRQDALKEKLASIQTKLDTLEQQSSILSKGMEEINASLEEQRKIVQTYFSKKNGVIRDKKVAQPQEVHLLKMNPPSTALKDTPRYSEKGILLDGKKRFHEVRPGESLYGIGKRYGISVDALLSLNNLSPKQPIHPGQKILVGPSK